MNRVSLLTLNLLFVILTAQAGPSTKGSEFHFLFGPNLFAPGKQFDTQILVTTNESEPVNFWISWDRRITRPGTQSNTTHTVSRGKVEIIDIPHVLSINSNNPRTPDIGIHLHSQGGKQLTVVGVNEQQASTDAFLVFPKIETKSKTYEYFALSVDRGPFSNIRSFFGFVTTEPDTTIIITPVTTISTFFVRFGVLLRGRNYTATVSAAGTSVAGTATSDLSGTRIVSDKPLSFFSGHECGLIPSDKTACDHLVEQVPPAETWGFKFFLVPLSTRFGDGYRILASRGGTACRVTCTNASLSETITLANPGDFRQLIYTTRYCSVECTHPVLIFQFSLGHNYDEAARSDPFAVMIPPVGQYSNDYDLVFFDSKEVDTRGEKVVFEAWINIAIPAEHDPSGLRFDGSPLSGVRFVDVTCSDGEVCGRVAQYKPTSDTGSHNLKHINHNATFVAVIYGWERENTYGYIGGMKFDDISGPKSPIFFKAPRNTTAVAGGRLLLECVARPVTSISWLLNSRPVVTSSRVIVNETVLTVNEVRTSDGGVYTCVAENSYGSVRRSAHVSITGVDDHSTCSADLEEFTCQCKKRCNSKMKFLTVEASDVDDLKRSIASLQEKVMLLESHTYCRYDGEIYPPGSVWITEGLSCSCKHGGHIKCANL